MSATEFTGGPTQVLNVRRIRRIGCHPVASYDDCTPETISDTENCLNWNGDLDNPNESEADCEADNESDVEQDNFFEDWECTKQQDVCAASNVPGLIRPTGRLKKRTEMGWVTVNATKRRSIRGNRKQ